VLSANYCTKRYCLIEKVYDDLLKIKLLLMYGSSILNI
jgi:hypothetical protein